MCSLTIQLEKFTRGFLNAFGQLPCEETCWKASSARPRDKHKLMSLVVKTAIVTLLITRVVWAASTPTGICDVIPNSTPWVAASASSTSSISVHSSSPTETPKGIIAYSSTSLSTLKESFTTLSSSSIASTKVSWASATFFFLFIIILVYQFPIKYHYNHWFFFVISSATR